MNKKTYTNNLVSNSDGFFYINSTNHFVQCTDNTCLTKYTDDSDISNNKYYTIVWGVVPIDNNQQRLMVLLQHKIDKLKNLEFQPNMSKFVFLI